MNLITKTFTVILIPLLTLNLCLPGVSSAAQSFSSPPHIDYVRGEGGVRGQIALVADAKVAKAQPEVLATPEEDIPVEKVEKGGVSWLWIILGIAAVGGIAAAAGGGSSSSSSSGGGGGGGSNGNATVTW